MKTTFKIMTLSSAVALAATLAFAQATPEELSAAVQARETHMKAQGAAVGVLGKMAQGEVPYDAAAAVEAATTLVTLSAADQSGFWLPGTEAGVYPESRALPAIWENAEDFAAKNAALNAAAVAMQTAAAVDLASLQAGMGALGGACGACHELYRQPQ